MSNPTPSTRASATFRQFFLRGLGILLPTVLTIYILVIVFQFVDSKIAAPINRGVKALTIHLTPWPAAKEEDYQSVATRLSRNPGEAVQRTQEWNTKEKQLRAEWRTNRRQQLENPPSGTDGTNAAPPVVAPPNTRRPTNGFEQALRAEEDAYIEGERELFVRQYMNKEARRHRLDLIWGRHMLGDWPMLDLIGLFIAIILIYMAGRFLGSFFGRKIYKRVEEWLRRLPLFKQVYPYVKQVTDFIVGDSTEKKQFNKVVAVQYPRKGIWSVGLVTGETMQVIEDAAGEEMMTVFVPSSPTPFTGYVITVAVKETVTLPITIDEALRFTVSGGVIVPPGQLIEREALAPTARSLSAEPIHSHADH